MSEAQEPETKEAPPVAASDASENGPDRERVAAPAAPVNPCLAAALRYASIGIPVLPLWWPRTDGTCACGTDCGKSAGKHPLGKLVPSGAKDATTDANLIASWWRQYPAANIGIVPGGARLVALDVDPRNGGLVEMFAPLSSVQWRTQSGGLHALFKHDDESIPQASRRPPGLDVLTGNKYIVAPPSRGPKGEYVAEDGAWAALERGELPSLSVARSLLAVPDWLRDLLKDGAALGTRDDTLIRVAGYLLGGQVRLPVEHVVNIMRTWDQRNRPPLETERPGYVEEKVRRFAQDHPEDREAEATVAHDERLTDLGNARRLVSRHGNDLRYVKTLRKWFVWDGRRWCADATDEVVRRAKEAVRAMYAEAATITDTDARQGLADHALRSEAEHRIRAMVKLAESEEGVAVRPEVFDTDPFLFNCLNGTVDLRTGELGPHCRAGLITKLAPVEYDPNARSETWERFLHDATNGNTELAEFLRRAVGYSLTGDTGEEVLFFVHGPAAAGKSTFLEAIKATLGEYAMTTPFETLVARQFKGDPRDDIAGLAGARFVSSVEVDEGTRLAESLVKTLTGGDTVRARHLYQEAFDFRPQCKLWLAANHAPKVRGDDPALWRRILCIPFDHSVPLERRDPAIKAALRDPSVAGPAILAWAVWGCLEWQRQRLGVPPIVVKATKAYQQEMDTFPDFLDDCCVRGREYQAAFRDLFQAYEEWRRRNRERPLTRKALGLQLKAHGFEPGAITKSRVYVGLAVATATWAPDEDKPAAAAVGA